LSPKSDLTATVALYIIAVGVVGAGLWHQDMHDYLPYLTSGMIVWTLVSMIVIEACNLFILGHALFRNVSFEYSTLASDVRLVEHDAARYGPGYPLSASWRNVTEMEILVGSFWNELLHQTIAPTSDVTTDYSRCHTLSCWKIACFV
jgi:hypothetical protein